MKNSVAELQRLRKGVKRQATRKVTLKRQKTVARKREDDETLDEGDAGDAGDDGGGDGGD